MRKSAVISIAILVIIYFSSYIVFRQTHIEIWEKDSKSYVIFPTDKIFLYYLFRPLTYFDGKITDMNFHIGQHQ